MLKIRYHSSFKKDYKKLSEEDMMRNFWKILYKNWQMEKNCQ